MSSIFLSVMMLLTLSISYADAIDLDRFGPMYQIMSYDEIKELPVEKREIYLKQIQLLFIDLEKMDQKRNPASLMEPGMPSLGKDGKVVCPGRLPGSTTTMKPYRIYKARVNTPQNPGDFICSALLKQTRDTEGCQKGFVPGLASWKSTSKSGYKEHFRYFCFSENSFKSLPLEKQKYIQRNVQEIIEQEKMYEHLAEKFKNIPRPRLQPVYEYKEPEHKEPFCGDLTLPVTTFPSSPDSQKCNEQIIKTAREKFYKGSTKLCIYGGNISQYRDHKVAAGNCEPPHQFCFESILCENTVTHDKLKPAYECAQGQIICNPLLFGIKADGKTPFCVPKGSSATVECQRLSDSSPKALHPLLIDENSRKGKYSSSVNLWNKVDGFNAVWNQFSDLFNKLCFSDKNGADFFCRECHAIKKKLFELNAVARDYTSCGQALQFSELGNRHLKPENKASGAK